MLKLSQAKRMTVSFSIYFKLCLVVFCLETCENANILAIFPLPSSSHMNIMKALVEPLLERGHQIDLVSHFPLKVDDERFVDIDISDSLPSYKDNITVEKSSVADIREIPGIMDLLLDQVVNAVLESKAMIKLKNSTKKYDLVIRHVFLNDALEAFAHIFDAPSIGVITSVNMPWTSNIVGLPDNPAYIPNYFSFYGEKIDYFQRFFNTLLHVFLKIKYITLQRTINNQIAKHFGPETPPIQQLLMKTSLVLCNSHYSIHQSRPLPPNFVEIGGIHIPKRRNEVLPEYLKSALDSAKQGLIYVSFGSLIRSEKLIPRVLEVMFEVLGKLPYKVFWKGNKEALPKTLRVPVNFYIDSWMPQLEILCHPNTKLFVSHGGLFGLQEAVHCGVPILGIPLLADQGSNLQLMVEKGVAKSVIYEDISEDTFSSALDALLEDKYKTNAEKLSKVFTDRLVSPIDTAVYWIEYVIRHKGAAHLKSAATKLEWYQYFLIDVIGGMLILFSIGAITMYLAILKLYRIIINGRRLGFIFYGTLKKEIKAE